MPFSAPVPRSATDTVNSGGTGFSYQATQALHNRPWYQQLLTQWGNPKELTDDQKAQIMDLAKQDPEVNKWAIVQGSDWQISDNGIIEPKNHFLRDALIAGGAFAAPFAIEALAGGGAAAGAAGGGAALPATQTVPLAGTLPAGLASGPGMAGTAGATGAAGAAGGGVLSKLSQVLGPAGKGIAAATQSAGQTQLANNELTANAAQINERANEAYQNELENLSGQERAQRASDVTNLARSSFAKNPLVSPFDPTGGPKYSPGYMEGLSDIEKQALARLAKDPTYDPTKIAPTKPTPYTPNTSMSTAQKIGNVAAPVLTAASQFLTPQPKSQSVMDALAPYLRFL